MGGQCSNYFCGFTKTIGKEKFSQKTCILQVSKNLWQRCLKVEGFTNAVYGVYEFRFTDFPISMYETVFSLE